MNLKQRTFLRAFSLTLVIIFCIGLAAAGICKSYENTVKTGFGETKTAVTFTENGIRILDFEIKWK